MNLHKSFFLLVFVVLPIFVFSANIPFKWLNDSTLVVNDGVSEQKYNWKNGSLTLLSAKSLKTNVEDKFSFVGPDVQLKDKPVSISHNIQRVNSTARTSAYTQLDLQCKFSDNELIRTLRVYDDTPGVEWRFSMKGENKLFPEKISHDIGMIENPSALSDQSSHYFFMPFDSRHYTTKIVSFREATDHHSNVVKSTVELPYFRPQYYQGNVLVADGKSNGKTHLIVKLSPLQNAQSAYFGFDFSTDFKGVKVFSPGFEHKTNQDKEVYQEAYPVFVLMYADDENSALRAYKSYELATHKYIPEKDNTFTMNTWGDRNRDSRVNEKFILNELDVANKLGVTHYQIDDGWQQGLSQNSSSRAGMLWDDWKKEDWIPHATRFPNGLKAVSSTADRLGIELGLWFNPSKANDYISWQRDKEIITSLHNDLNVSWVKIDGLQIGTKTAENNVYRMLQGAIDESDGNIQFNIDVTAGRRGGYFFFNKFGNIFLENRYTDWGNYYPHLTLRNVWSLSRYVPIQRFQIEWLNKWRNDDKYPANDPLKPMNVPFDYQFAITLMGQPLAWMEATGLPAEAFDVVPLIHLWKSERTRMQSGVIISVGEMPDGYSFPGFVSYAKDRTYVLLFRENTKETSGIYPLPTDEVSSKKFVKLAGSGELIKNSESKLEIKYSAPFQFIWGYFQ